MWIRSACNSQNVAVCGKEYFYFIPFLTIKKVVEIRCSSLKCISLIVKY